MSAQPDETTTPLPAQPPRPVDLVQRRADGAILVGAAVYGTDEDVARARAVDACELHDLGSWPRLAGEAVLDFLDGAHERAAHADRVAAFPAQAHAVQAPPVDLRVAVDVARVERLDFVVRVPPAQLADDPTGAVQDAARALHDAVLAATRVLVVEPAERDRP